MKIGLTLPQGCDREYLGLDAATAWTRTVEVAQLGRGRRLRVALGQRPHAGRSAARGGADLRAVRRAGGPRDRNAPGPTRPLVLAAAYRNAGLTAKAISTARRHQRRPGDPGHRRRLEGGRVARLRLRLPAGRRATGDPRRPSRDHQPDARPGTGDLGGRARPRPRRDPRAEGAPAAAHPDPDRRQRPEGDLAAGGAVRRRAEPRRPHAGPGRGGPAGDRASRCPRSGATRRRLAVSVHIWGDAGDVRPGPERRQRLRDYAALGLDRAIVQGFVPPATSTRSTTSSRTASRSGCSARRAARLGEDAARADELAAEGRAVAEPDGPDARGPRLRRRSRRVVDEERSSRRPARIARGATRRSAGSGLATRTSPEITIPSNHSRNG